MAVLVINKTNKDQYAAELEQFRELLRAQGNESAAKKLETNLLSQEVVLSRDDIGKIRAGFLLATQSRDIDDKDRLPRNIRNVAYAHSLAASTEPTTGFAPGAELQEAMFQKLTAQPDGDGADVVTAHVVQRNLLAFVIAAKSADLQVAIFTNDPRGGGRADKSYYVAVARDKELNLVTPGRESRVVIGDAALEFAHEQMVAFKKGESMPGYNDQRREARGKPPLPTNGGVGSR